MTLEIPTSSTNSIFNLAEVFIKVEVVIEEDELPIEMNETSFSTRMISWMKEEDNTSSVITEVKEFQLAVTIVTTTSILLMRITEGIGVEKKKKFLKF